MRLQLSPRLDRERGRASDHSLPGDHGRLHRGDRHGGGQLGSPGAEAVTSEKELVLGGGSDTWY